VFSGIYKEFGKPAFSWEFPVLSPKSISYLLQKKCRVYATDAPGVDPLDSVDFPNHKILLGAGIPIIEGLANLEAIKTRNFLLCAFPLKLIGREAAPCRAVALMDMDVEN
jgi:arylformamidase